jgi:tetratricopeptide (TPR) repeat protein
LEIPEDLVEIFCNVDLNPLEMSFIEQARENFNQSLIIDPLAELDTEAWKNRLLFPIGLDDAGHYFPLDFNPMGPKIPGGQARVGFSLSRVLNHQARVHTEAGDLATAESALLEAIRLEGSCRKPDPDTLASSHVLLSQIHRELGDLIRTEADLHEAFFYAKQPNQEQNRTRVSQIVHLLGQVYHSNGQYDYAERNYMHALKIARNDEGRSSRVAQILSSLGALDENRGNIAESDAHLREALDIIVENHGKESPEYAGALNNLARQTQAAGRYEEAGVLLRDALAILERKEGRSSTELELLHFNLAEVYAAIEQPLQALDEFRKALLGDSISLVQAFMAGSERQRLQRLRNTLFRLGQLLSLVVRSFKSDPGVVRLVADLVLSRKGLVAEAAAVQRNLSRSENESLLRSVFRELAELRARIARDALAGPGPEGARAHRTRLAEETRRAEDLEVRLAREIPQTGFQALLLENASSHVARSIPPGGRW